MVASWFAKAGKITNMISATEAAAPPSHTTNWRIFDFDTSRLPRFGATDRIVSSAAPWGTIKRAMPSCPRLKTMPSSRA